MIGVDDLEHLHVPLKRHRTQQCVSKQAIFQLLVTATARITRAKLAFLAPALSCFWSISLGTLASSFSSLGNDRRHVKAQNLH